MSRWLRRLTRTSTCVLALALALVHTGEGRALNGLTVEGYCQLSSELLQLSAAEWTERVAVTTAHGRDAKAHQVNLDAVSATFKGKREATYQKFETSIEEQLVFGVSHSADISSYLEDNPEVGSRIDALSAEVRSLIMQYETVAASQQKGAQP